MKTRHNCQKNNSRNINQLSAAKTASELSPTMLGEPVPVPEASEASCTPAVMVDGGTEGAEP